MFILKVVWPVKIWPGWVVNSKLLSIRLLMIGFFSITFICMAAQIALASPMSFKPLPRALDASTKSIVMSAGERHGSEDTIPLKTPDFSLLSESERDDSQGTAVRIACKDRTGQSYSQEMAGFETCMSDTQFQALDYDKNHPDRRPQLESTKQF